MKGIKEHNIAYSMAPVFRHMILETNEIGKSLGMINMIEVAISERPLYTLPLKLCSICAEVRTVFNAQISTLANMHNNKATQSSS